MTIPRNGVFDHRVFKSQTNKPNLENICAIETGGKRPPRMKVKGVLGCALIIMMAFFIAESTRFPKRKRIGKNWGPQSMLYLKGRYGRRYAAASDEEQCYKLDLDDFDQDLKSYKRSAPLKYLNLGRKLTAQNLGIDYLD